MTDIAKQVMAQAVESALAHVNEGGLPFVGVLLHDQSVVSSFGVNRVQEHRDPTAHAEIEAIRDARRRDSTLSLGDTILLATGEPCGMCYRFAIRNGIRDIRVAVHRDEVASFGFDYLESYDVFGITDSLRSSLMTSLRVPGDDQPFRRYLSLHS